MKPEDSNPIHHCKNMESRLDELADHLRKDLRKVDEPQFKALAETAAEVLGGLKTAFRDYREGSEDAWIHGRSGGE